MTSALQSLGPFRGVTVFFAALAIGLIAIVLLRRFWVWERGRDAGDGVRKLQTEPILRVGGLALFGVFLFACLVAISGAHPEKVPLLGWPFFLLGSTMFLLGFLDDLFGLPALLRLFVQIGVGVAAYLCEMRIDMVSHPLGAGEIETGAFGLILTVIWFVSIPNLINLVDGMDGLAGGIALFLSLTLATLGAFSGHQELLLLNVALVGGIVAFLVFNLPPAKIYMGDGGAYLLGFIIAGSSLLTANKGSIFGALLVVIIALGFPILDTALAMLRRALTGLPLMRPDALHLHHRLLTLGFSKRNILFILYGVFAGLSLLGLSVFLSAGYSLPIVGMIATIAVIQTMRFVGLPHNLREVKRVLHEIVTARKDIRYAYSMSLVLEHDLERVRSAESFWGNFRVFLERLEISPVVPGNPVSPEEAKKIVILRIDDRTLWVLHCPRPEGTSRRWERVARCFLSAIMGARANWGRALPASLGFVELGDEAELLAVEASLKADGGFAPSKGGAPAHEGFLPTKV
jgi:UDP-GlcNAc:undecaprenyl-phosphate/decaprenyl-phosphate GlcNAc-1-phosphate transferase